MDIKIEIKEEPALESTSKQMRSVSQQTTVSYFVNSVSKYETDVAISRNDCETLEKPFVPNTCVWNDLTLKQECDNSTAADMNYFPKHLKTEITEDYNIEVAPVISVENSVCTERKVEVQTNIPECPEDPRIDTKICIKEDPLWLEETSMETKLFETSPLQKEIQGTTMCTNGAHKELPLSKLRCHLGSDVADGRGLSTYFSNANLKMEDNLKIIEHNSDLEKARTTEVEGSDVTDTSHQTNDIQHAQKAPSCKGKKLRKSKYKCQICEKTFAWRSDFRTHKFVHEDIKPYQCNICDMGFIRKSSLREHNMKHEGKKPYKCSICEKSFVRMTNLNTHSLIHKTEKPPIVSCRLCKESFAHMIHFKAHKKVHAGKALHVCHICGKSYTFKSELKRHSISHEARKRNQCPICQKRFTYVYHMNRHIFVIHGTKCS